MSSLAFFPWLHVHQPVSLGAARILPYPIDAGGACNAKFSLPEVTVRAVLQQYVLMSGRPVSNLTLVEWDGKPIGTDIPESARETLFRLAELLAVAGMATRTFCGGIVPYSAKGHYQLIIQQIPDPFTGHVSVTHRRKDGASCMMIAAIDHRFLLPEHLVMQARGEIDVSLLDALVRASSQLEEKRWAPIADALRQFNLANTDSPDIPVDSELISTFTALERLAGANTSEGKFVHNISELLCQGVIRESALEFHEPAFDSKAELGAKTELQSWLTALYRLRGHCAHGQSAETYQSGWDVREHLLAGAFVFPLLLKSRLSSLGLYDHTERDFTYILALNYLVRAKPFFSPSDDDDSEEPQKFDIHRPGWGNAMQAVDMRLSSLKIERFLRAQLLE